MVDTTRPAAAEPCCRSQAADAAAGFLAAFLREPRCRHRARRGLVNCHHGNLGAADLAPFADRAVPRRHQGAADLFRRRPLGVHPRHRRGRPRHALPPDAWRPRFAVHRPFGDAGFDHRRRRPRDVLRLWPRRAWQVARNSRRHRQRHRRGHHAGDGPDRLDPFAGAGDPDHRHHRAEPHQHHHRRHCRLPATLRAPLARLGNLRVREKSTSSPRGWPAPARSA